MRKLAKPSRLQRIDEIIPRALKKRHVPYQAEDRRLCEIWEKAVGAEIAAQSRPGYVKRDTLFVRVANSVWMQQLHFLKADIIGKVNAHMEKPSLKDIRFTIGSVPSFRGKGSDVPATPFLTGSIKARDRDMMENCLSSLADQELKETIRRVMIKEISWRRRREKKVP